MARIALPYRIYFLYIEPFLAVIGGISAFLTPNDIMAGSTPLSMLPAALAPITPLSKILISNLGAMYFLFGWNVSNLSAHVVLFKAVLHMSRASMDLQKDRTPETCFKAR